VFDLELNTTKIEEIISESSKKIMNIEMSKEWIEKDVIKMQEEMVREVNFEAKMKDNKKKMQKLENLVHDVKNMNVTLENFIDRYECIRI
jgi:hypothetical protein